jgi:hypothetical protein
LYIIVVVASQTRTTTLLPSEHAASVYDFILEIRHKTKGEMICLLRDTKKKEGAGEVSEKMQPHVIKSSSEDSTSIAGTVQQE